MKTKHFQKLAIASAMMIMSVPALAQTIAGASSTAYVVTGPSTLMGIGKAGISMPGTNPPTTNPFDQSAIVSFAGGPIMQTNYAYDTQPGPYYYVYISNGAGGTMKMAQTWRADAAYGTKIYAYRQISNPLPTFPHFGGEVVAKVKDHEVYFGEWAPKGSNTGTGNDTNLNLVSSLRTVFYVGENPTASMPNLVNAKYDVVGVRRYNPGTQGGVHTGTLTANYSISSASGTLTGTVWSANFSGTTIASNGTFQNSTGTIKGRFYGASASALAGIYNPSGHANDMAFGGAKRP